VAGGGGDVAGGGWAARGCRRVAKQQKGSKGKRGWRERGLPIFCLRQPDVEITGSVIRPLFVFASASLSFYQLASHPHHTLLTGYTANGHPYRFYNSIYVNTHLSND